MMIMASCRRRQRPQSKLLSGSWSFSTTIRASKQTYATAALLWSVPLRMPRTTRTTALTPPQRNISTSSPRFSNTDTLSYRLGSLFEGEVSIGEGGGRSIELSPHLIWHHFTEPIGSTQDEARRLLHEQHPMEKALAVFADVQLEGRGTQGRRWERGDTSSDDVRKDGNLYLTVCIPQNQIPITITLLPLQIGVFVAERISRLIDFCRRRNGWNEDNSTAEIPSTPHLTLKWPNDVLVNDQKISGTLIEFESVSYEEVGSTDASVTWMLIGIGVNVASAPRNLSKLPRPGKHIRRACCIEDFCSTPTADGNMSVLPEPTAVILAQDVSSAIANWVFGEDRMESQWQKEEALLQQWNSYAEWGVQYELRGRIVKEEEGGYEGEKVTTMGIERDGQLRVRGADGRERLLVAEYLF
jgi:BirA family transcriptional regulator, biotin operon repressor / biotin---[acetyl-CoA-carboxylase] ligase